MKLKNNPLQRKSSPLFADDCSIAWKKHKESYMSRKSKTKVERQDDGSYKKVDVPISAEDNLKEYNREKREFECVDGKIKLRKTDDAERPVKSDKESNLAPDRKSSKPRPKRKKAKSVIVKK